MTFTVSARFARALAGLRPPEHLPPRVRAALADPRLTHDLTTTIRRISSYQNLTNNQRRERAQTIAEAQLLRASHRLTDPEITILVALLYWRVKEETPFLIAPEPKRW